MQIKKNSKFLFLFVQDILNIRIYSTGIYNDFFDFEESVSSSTTPLNNKTVEIEFLSHLSNSDHSMKSLGKYPYAKKSFL